jgi:hypothetical protein
MAALLWASDIILPFSDNLRLDRLEKTQLYSCRRRR